MNGPQGYWPPQGPPQSQPALHPRWARVAVGIGAFLFPPIGIALLLPGFTSRSRWVFGAYALVLIALATSNNRSAQAIAAFGEIAEAEGVAIAVVGTERTNAVSGERRDTLARDGAEFLLVTFRFAHGLEGDQNPRHWISLESGDTSFDIHDDCTVAASGNWGHEIVVNPGITIEDTVCFEVPLGTSGHLLHRPNFWSRRGARAAIE